MTHISIHKKSAVFQQRKGYDKIINSKNTSPFSPGGVMGADVALAATAQSPTSQPHLALGWEEEQCPAWHSWQFLPLLLDQRSCQFSQGCSHRTELLSLGQPKEPISRGHCPPVSVKSQEPSLTGEYSSLPTRWEDRPQRTSLCFILRLLNPYFSFQGDYSENFFPAHLVSQMCHAQSLSLGCS